MENNNLKNKVTASGSYIYVHYNFFCRFKFNKYFCNSVAAAKESLIEEISSVSSSTVICLLVLISLVLGVTVLPIPLLHFIHFFLVLGEGGLAMLIIILSSFACLFYSAFVHLYFVLPSVFEKYYYLKNSSKINAYAQIMSELH